MVTAERLSACEFFAPIEPSVVPGLADYFEVADYQAGATVFEEGAPGTDLYVIERGSLEVLKATISGEHLALAELRRGQVVGEMAVMDLRPRSATVRAKTDATLLTISRDKLLKMLQENPRAGAALLMRVGQLLSERLRLSSVHLV